MELPHIGEHCAESTCNKFDFLPFKCNLCKKLYCLDHHKYEAHSCPESYKLDAQIPICPLCEKPVPNKPGLTPDLAVNEHLENNCKSKTKKIYSKKCSVIGCKQKEMIPVQCSSCSSNYCLRHRNPIDHECKEPIVVKREQTMNGSIFKNWFKGESSKINSSSVTSRSSQIHATSNENSTRSRLNNSPASQPPRAIVTSLQGNLSEQEALEQAILASTQGKQNNASLTTVSTSEDEALAQAIAASLEENQANSRSKIKISNDCTLS